MLGDVKEYEIWVPHLKDCVLKLGEQIKEISDFLQFFFIIKSINYLF